MKNVLIELFGNIEKKPYYDECMKYQCPMIIYNLALSLIDVNKDE